MAYSADLRNKALTYYKQCKNISQTAATFNLSRNTLYLWIRLKKQTGSLKHQVTGLNAVKLDRQNRLNMLGNIRMPICMKSPNILIVRQPPFAMHSNRWGWRAKKDHHLQRTRPGHSNALFDTAGRIFRLPTCLFGWNRIWPLPVPSLCPQPERANSESADKWKKIPTLISGVRTSRQPADCSDGLSKYDDRSLFWSVVSAMPTARIDSKIGDYFR